MPDSRPNIILLNPDSYRGDVVGHLGNPAAVTPHLDALAADGVSFAKTFSQNPVCTPSRCSFMTGWYPHVHGHRSMRNMLKEHEPHLLNVLRDNGYYTWWGGKNDLVAVESREDYLKHCDFHHAPAGKDTGLRPLQTSAQGSPLQRVFYQGLLEPRDEEGYNRNKDAEHVAAAAEFIRGWDKDRPFCVFLPLGLPHPGYQAEAALRARIPDDQLPPRIPAAELRGTFPEIMAALRREYGSDAVTEAEWRELKAVYYAMCTKVDELLGEVVAALKESNQYDETLLVFFSDHGDYAGDYNLPEKSHALLHDALVHVPFVVKPPADLPCRPGTRQHLTELVDLTATIYDLLGIDPGYWHQGRSLRDSLAGADDELRDAVFAEVGSRAGEWAFVNDQVKKMAPDSFYATQARAALPFAGKGSYAVMCRTQRYKYVRRGYVDAHELYDLENDPGETHNLSGDPAMIEIERELQQRLLDFFMQTADVLPFKADSRGI